MNRLKGKYTLITGASQGLGRQLAIDFAREGPAGWPLLRVAPMPSKKCESQFAVASQARVLIIIADLSREEEIERVIATTLEEFHGRLDVLVNNASSIGPTPLPYLLDYPLADFRRVIDTNLVAPFLLIKKALPAMIETGGSVINVTSDAGRVGYPDGALMASPNSVLKECPRPGRLNWGKLGTC